MEAISRIPKILDTIEQMRENYDLRQVFENYKKNVKVFIEAFKAEVSELISHYENTIKNLKIEISTLKSGEQGCKFTRTPPLSKFYSSPQKAKLDDLMQTTNSININLTKSAKWDSLPVSTIFKKKGFEDSNFQEDFINHYEQAWQNNQSKFEEVSKKRKQREQELRLYLQSGKKSMNTTTQLFLEAVGKNKRQQNTNQKDQDEDKQDEENGSRRQQSLNKSLGQICESLDKSFIAQRARSEKKKKMASIERQMKSKQKILEQTAKMLKDRGIKSLLQRLRNNVQISPHQTPEKITTSKLFSTNPKTKQKDNLSNTSRKSKVMINPVPVDIVNRSRATSYSKDSSLSPDLKPQSILKKNTTILSGYDLPL